MVERFEKTIKRLRLRIADAENRLEEMRQELQDYEDGDHYAPMLSRDRVKGTVYRHPKASIVRYLGYGEGEDLRLEAFPEELSWNKYQQQVRGVALLSYGLKRIPSYFIVSQFEKDVPPESAAQIARKNVDGRQLKAFKSDNCMYPIGQ